MLVAWLDIKIKNSGTYLKYAGSEFVIQST